MTETTELAELEHPATIPATREAVNAFASAANFDLAQRMASMLAKSTMVPQAYQNNIPNTVVALNMAQRLNADPLMVMQNLYIVHGNPAWSSKFMIACVNSCGRFSALRYEMSGEPGKDSRTCVAWAEEKATGQRLDGPAISLAMAKAEGWTDKNGSKWKTMPEVMLRYRAASFWVRQFAPEISMGLRTVEEEKEIAEIKEVPAKVADAPVVSPLAGAGRKVTKKTAEPQTQTEADPQEDYEREVIIQWLKDANQLVGEVAKDILAKALADNNAAKVGDLPLSALRALKVEINNQINKGDK